MNNNPMNMLMQFMGMSNNPQQIINNLMMQNPQAQMVMNQMQQSGMSTKDFVLQYAKQNNIDINPMVQMLQKKGIKL